MKRGLTLLPLAAMVASPGVAADAPSPQQVRKFLADYGTCIVKREPEMARKAVLSGDFLNPRDPDGRRLVQRECLPDTIAIARMGDLALKGAIADALFARDAAQLSATEFAGVPALTYAEPWPVRFKDRNGSDLPGDQIARQQEKFDQKAGEVQRSRMAECVTRAAGAQVRGVLTTAIDTPAELAALKAMAPAIGPCVPAGVTTGFDRMALRGALAVAYVRLASAAQTNVGKPGTAQPSGANL